jgi:hypothetical protein
MAEGPGASARRRSAGKARTRRSVAAKGRPQLCSVVAYRTRCRCYMIGVPGSVAWPSLRLDKCALYRMSQYHTIQNLSSTVLAHAGYFMLDSSKHPKILETKGQTLGG